MSDVATLPPVHMGQFEVIPTIRGWRLVLWEYDEQQARYRPKFIKFMDWPKLRRMY